MAAAGVEALGRTTRLSHGETEILLVRSGRAALAAWRERHEQGRILVHAGRFLHFVDDDRDQAMRETLTAPGHGRELDDQLFRLAGPSKYLWVAASTGIARQIVYVSPPEALDERLASLGWSRSVLPASIPWEVFPRSLEASFPRIDEPVMLEICASWFDDARTRDPLAEILASGLHPDLIVVNLAEDAEDVSDHAREAARSLAAALGASAARHHP
jgi:hypothetical protein